MHLFLINQGPLKLLMAFFISIHYVPDLNLTVICSSVTFHHPWHAVFDTSRQCLSMHVRRAFQKTPVRCSSVILTAVWHTALRSPLAKSLHRHSASHSLMSQHISHPVWAVFNVAGLPHTHTHTHNQLSDLWEQIALWQACSLRHFKTDPGNVRVAAHCAAINVCRD